MPAPKDPEKYKIWLEKNRQRMIGNKWNLGKKASEATRKKMSAERGGVKNAMYGKKHSETTREKLKKAPKAMGSASGNWKGGTRDWWKRMVLKRDDYTCQRCRMKELLEGFMDADHIEPKSKYPEIQFEISNGQTLCPNCHRRKSLENGDYKH